MARPRKARTEGERVLRIADGTLKPTTKREAEKAEAVKEERHVAAWHADNFAAAVEQFQRAYPEEWESIRLCPTQHGIEVMIEALNKEI